MGLDSSANLLFTISADASGAQSALQNFNSTFGSSLENAKADFADWLEGILSGSSTAEEAMAGIGPAMEAGFLVAAAAAASLVAGLAELGRKQMDLVETVEQGTRATGLNAEQLSGMMFAAEQTGLSQEKLSTSMVRFANAVSAAGDPTSKQAKAFAALGISQDEVNAGQTDLYPLLLRTMDAYRTHADDANKAAISTTLFRDRTATLTQFLDMGSQALHDFNQRAHDTGNILTEEDVKAAKLASLAWADFRGELEGVAHQMGQQTIPTMGVIAIQLEGLKAAAVAFIRTWASVDWKTMALGPVGVVLTTIKAFRSGVDAENEAMEAAVLRIQKAMKALQAPENQPHLPNFHEKGGTPDVDTQAKSYTGLSDILERVKVQLAGATSEEQKIAAETDQLSASVLKAIETLTRMANEGKIDTQSYEREWQALHDVLPLIQQVSEQKMTALSTKRNHAEIAARQDLTQRIEAQQTDTYQHQVNLWNDEINKLEARLAKEKTLSAANEALLEQLRAAGLAKRERAQSEAWAKELNTLSAALHQMQSQYESAEQKIEDTYRQDLRQYSAAEEAKAKLTAANLAEANFIHIQFEQLRHAALLRMQTDTNTLHNSQGWQGIFGNLFTQGLKNNETLMQQWAQSANRDLLMVKVAVEDLKEQFRQCFDQMAQAEAQAVVQAFVAGESIGQAMRKAASDTISALASQAAVQAIMATAEGFWDLAIQNYAGAAEAFEAAGLFAVVAGGAAVAARAIAPKTASSSSNAGMTGDTSSTAAASTSASGSTSGSSGPPVNVYVYGHVIGPSGIGELASMLNEAVQGRDVRLVATQVKSLRVTTR